MTDEEFIRFHLRANFKTGKLYWKHAKQGRKLAWPAGNVNGAGYMQIRIQGTSYQQHRVIWFFAYAEWPKTNLDHINGVKSDNRLENLRECSNSTNSHNVHNRAEKYIKHDGLPPNVRFHKGTYEGRITIKGKRTVRCFSTPEAAADWVESMRPEAR